MKSINKIYTRLKFSAIFIIAFLGFVNLNAQDSLFKNVTIQKNPDKLPTLIFNDTVAKPSIDSNRIKSPSGIDTVITFYGEDSVVFDLQKQTMRLNGKANVNFKTQKLKAEIIEVSFKDSKLSASAGKDTSGKMFGFPQFNDSGEEFSGEKLSFNMKTKQGVITGAETQMGEGYYYGAKIKRISQSELFVKDGYYTTCSSPQPHFYFGSPEMKMAVKDRIFLDPLIFYVEDMPVFMLPFGLFFPNKSGRQSGITVPSFFFSKSRGVAFENFGFYWAASDYWDSQFAIDIYTKGGYTLKNNTRWALKNSFTGGFDIRYGKTRSNPDLDFSNNYSINLQHNQNFTPYDNATINLHFTSQDFNRNTSNYLGDRITQSITSNASYSKNFENGSTFSISYQSEKNIITNDFSQSIPVTYSIPTFYPVKKLVKVDENAWYGWIKDLSLSYRANYNYSDRTAYTVSQIPNSNPAAYDTSSSFNKSSYISHSPSISISPKFGYFTISPFVNFGANNYFRKLTRTVNAKDSSITEEYKNGLFTEYFYGFGLSASTKLFGIADDSHPLLGFIKPSSLGFKAFRHSYSPSLSFNFTPSFAGPSFDFYGRYTDLRTNQEIIYSRFANDGGSHAPSYVSKSLNYNDNHRFEMKIKQGDTIPDKNLELLILNTNFGYNFALDSLKLSTISLGFSSPALKIVEFSGSAVLDPYMIVKRQNAFNPKLTEYARVNQFLISEGKGLARLQSFNLSLSTSFNSKGSIDVGSIEHKELAKKDTAGILGQRFLLRHEDELTNSDIFGDCSPGYTDFAMSWAVNLGLNFGYNDNGSGINRNITMNANARLQLTETWKMNANFMYDFIQKELMAPSFDFTKDLHCWELTFRWTPVGPSQGFYLKFGIRSALLNDLKIEKRDSPLWR